MEGLDTTSSGSALPYPSRLFMVQYNLILLGGAVLFSMASNSPLPLAVGAAVEVVFLVVGSSLPGVRRWLDQRDAAARRAAADQAVMVAVQGLDTEYATRLFQLEQALGEIRDVGGPRPEPSFDQAVTLLETLRPVYLGLCETHQRISRFIAATSESDLSNEMQRLKLEFAAQKDLGQRLALRQAYAAAQQRLEHREGLLQALRTVGTKLETVERGIAYFRAQGLALTANLRLHEEAEALVTEIGPALAVEVEPEVAAELAAAGATG